MGAFLSFVLTVKEPGNVEEDIRKIYYKKAAVSGANATRLHQRLQTSVHSNTATITDGQKVVKLLLFIQVFRAGCGSLKLIMLIVEDKKGKKYEPSPGIPNGDRPWTWCRPVVLCPSSHPSVVPGGTLTRAARKEQPLAAR